MGRGRPSQLPAVERALLLFVAVLRRWAQHRVKSRRGAAAGAVWGPGPGTPRPGSAQRAACGAFSAACAYAPTLSKEGGARSWAWGPEACPGLLCPLPATGSRRNGPLCPSRGSAPPFSTWSQMRASGRPQALAPRSTPGPPPPAGRPWGSCWPFPARPLCLRRCVGSTCSQGPGGRPALWPQRLLEPCLAGVFLPLPCSLFFPFL